MKEDSLNTTIHFRHENMYHHQKPSAESGGSTRSFNRVSLIIKMLTRLTLLS